MIKDGLCIAVTDVNGLKETNDTLGHAAGDELIAAVPEIAKKAFGDAAIVARMGGDEFALPPEELYQAADKLMYEDKSAYYRLKGHDRRRR